MQQNPALAYKISIEDILVKHVGEAIAGGERAIGQFLFIARLDKPVNPSQAIKSLLQIELVHAQQLGQHGRDELLALNTRVLKRSPILFAQCFNRFADHTAHALRRLQVHLRERARQGPVLVGSGNITVLGEKLHQAGRKHG